MPVAVNSLRVAATALLIGAAACDSVSHWSSSQRNGGEIVLSGTVDAHEVEVSFQVGGRVQRLHTDEGHSVASGELLAEIDPRDFELSLARSRAQATSSDKALAVLLAGSRVQDVRAAEAALGQAQADRKLAQIQQARTAKLVAEKFAPPQQLDAANDALDVATAKVEQSRQNLSLLREGARKEDIERARADAEAARVVAAIAEQQLAYTRLASPAAGVVSVRLIEQGQNVNAGQPIVRIAELARPWVRVYLDERDLPRVRLGQAAKVIVDGVPGKTFSGHLSFISPAAEFTPKTVETRELRVDLVYRAKVDVDDADGLLKIGMPADVRLDAAQ